MGKDRRVNGGTVSHEPLPAKISTKCIFLLSILLVLGCLLQFVRWEDLLTLPGIKAVPSPLLQRNTAGNTSDWRHIVNGRYTAGISTDSSDSGSRSLSTPFHPKWKADCFEIINGNEDEIKRVVRILSRQRTIINHKPKKPLMPLDSEVLRWTQDCTTFRRIREYPKVSTEEESAFPIAYILVVHKQAAQVERLLRAIYQPQNIYCIHIDDKSPGAFKGAVAGFARCFENVFLSSRTESVQYAGFTRLLADIDCMKDLMTGPTALVYPWRYVISLSGQDFPLKSNLEIVRQLRSYDGHNDIGVDEPPPYKRKWTGYHYVVEEGHVVRTQQHKGPAPHNLTVYAGLAYYIASRRFVNYVLNNQTAKDLLEWTKDTYSPDENYWATLQAADGTPGGSWQAPNGSAVRFIRWFGRSNLPVCRGHTIRSTCVFSMGYLQYLVSQRHLFANKFDYTYDPVALQCLEEHIENKTRHEIANHLRERCLNNCLKL